MRRLFWSDDDGRLRVGWRLAIALALFLLLTRLPRMLLTGAGYGDWVRPEGPADLPILLASLIALWWAARYIDRRRFADFGIVPASGRWWVDFAFGTGLSMVLVSVIFGLEYALQWVIIEETFASLDGTRFVVTLTPSLVGVIATAIYTELWFRGYLVVNLNEGFGFLSRIDYRSAIVAAWAGSTIIYALLRIPDDGLNLVLLANVLRAGFLLVLPFILTRNLGMSIGMSLGWNVMEQHVYGFSVTNFLYNEVSVLVVSQHGPPMLTGGELGPVAGLLGMFAMIIGGAAVFAWVRITRGKDASLFRHWASEYHLSTPEVGKQSTAD